MKKKHKEKIIGKDNSTVFHIGNEGEGILKGKGSQLYGDGRSDFGW